MIHWDSTTIAVLIALYAVALACLLVFRKWGSAVLLTVCILISALLISDLLMQVSDMRTGTSIAAQQFDYAGTLLKMYETGAKFEAADAKTKNLLRPRLLESCRSVQKLNYCFPLTCSTEYDFLPSKFRDMKCVDWKTFPSKNMDMGYEVAGLWIAAESLSDRERMTTFSRLVVPSSEVALYDRVRVQKLIAQRAKGDYWNTTVIANCLEEHTGQIISYSLSGWYASRQQYGNALNRLVTAFGEKWLIDGKIDKWWTDNLPPGHSEHRYFGYILYKNGLEAQALREFRLGRGSNKTLSDMQREYR